MITFVAVVAKAGGGEQALDPSLFAPYLPVDPLEEHVWRSPDGRVTLIAFVTGQPPIRLPIASHGRHASIVEGIALTPGGTEATPRSRRWDVRGEYVAAWSDGSALFASSAIGGSYG